MTKLLGSGLADVLLFAAVACVIGRRRHEIRAMPRLRLVDLAVAAVCLSELCSHLGSIYPPNSTTGLAAALWAALLFFVIDLAALSREQRTVLYVTLAAAGTALALLGGAHLDRSTP